MKIPLTIRMRFGQPMPFVFIGIRSRRYRIRPIPIWAMVDTGSPWTAITPYDAMMLNIPFSALEKAPKYPVCLFGGHKFWRLLLTDVDLRIRDEMRKMVPFDLPSVSVLNPTKKIPPDEFKGAPSVLGNDFLDTKGFCLHFNPSKREAFLLSGSINKKSDSER